MQTRAPPKGKESKEETIAGERGSLAEEASESDASHKRKPPENAQSGDQPPSLSSSSSVTVGSSSSSSEPKLAAADGSASEVAAAPSPAGEQDGASGEPETGGSLLQADVHASLENGEKERPPSSTSLEEKQADSEWKEEEEDNDDGSKKEDYSEGDLVDVSAYSGLGEEDSGGSQLDEDEEDEEDEEAYHPESSCSEMPGLPEEEEQPPPNRKIRFSTGPIKVGGSYLLFTLGRTQRLRDFPLFPLLVGNDLRGQQRYMWLAAWSSCQQLALIGPIPKTT